MSHKTTDGWIYQIIDIRVKSYEPRSGEPFINRNKIYMWPDNETSFENFVNRTNRPYTTYKKDLIPQLMEWLEKNMPNYYEELKDSKWGWRQSCGCSMCPCSPGFISDTDGCITIHVNFV